MAIHDHSENDHDEHPDVAENEHESYFWLDPLLLRGRGFAVAAEYGLANCERNPSSSATKPSGSS